MSRIIRESMEDRPKLHHGIKCLTCKKMISSKRELPKYHRGHDVVYLDEAGEPQK